jgi:adenylosuccinate lyase
VKYQTPFADRYGSDEMRALWSTGTERKTWRRIWVAVASIQAEAGLISDEQLADIVKHQESLDLNRSLALESEIDHDLMAELRVFAEQCKVGGGVLHWGLTSADIKDNCDVIRQRIGTTLLLIKLRDLLLRLADRIQQTASLTILGYTHLQPAQPTTLGYRLSFYAQDFLMNFEALLRLKADLKGKGIKGAIGTSASLHEMLEGSTLSVPVFEEKVMALLELTAFSIASQTYTRLQDFILLATLSGLATSLHKFGTDIRLMQSSGFRTAMEPFGEKQVGSSAMPFKQNPILAERLCSLTRLVPAYAQTAWTNASQSMLERTLDDSANRRSAIPESFLAVEEGTALACRIVDGLQIDPRAIDAQLDLYGPFVALEQLLNALVGQGADRQEMHELLRVHSLQAWEAIESGDENPLIARLKTDTRILNYLQPVRIETLMKPAAYTGLAETRAEEMAESIRERFNHLAAEESGT